MKTLGEKLIEIEKTLRDKVHMAMQRDELDAQEREDLRLWCKDLAECRELIGKMNMKLQIVNGKWELSFGSGAHDVRVTLDEVSMVELRDLLNNAINSSE